MRQILFGRLGTSFAEDVIVSLRSPLIAMPFNGNTGMRVCFEPLCIGFQNPVRLSSKSPSVIGKKDIPETL